MKLPIFQTVIQELSLLQSKWSSLLNVLLNNPSLQCLILQDVPLLNGSPTVINHTLGRVLIGWRVIGIDGVARIYDTQATNPRPALTLVLVSDAAVTVNLEVF